MKTLMVLIIAFVSTSAQASNPLSDFCRAVVAEPTGAAATTYPQGALICAYQRDNSLEELGNISDQTCQHMAERVRAEFPGKSVQFAENSADHAVYTRCVNAGAIAGKGGLAIVVSEPPKPAEERPPVDLEALKAKVAARITALKADKATLNGLGNHSQDAKIDENITRYQKWLDDDAGMDELGRALYKELMEQVTPPPPEDPPWYTRTWAKITGGGFIGAAVVVGILLL